MMNHLSLHFIYSHKSYMILSVHCAAAHDVRACAAPSPTHTVTINIYHFMGSIAHRPPLVHPDCPLELFCTPTVPLRGHATTVCMGSEARQVLKPPSPALWPSARRAAMAIFSGSELQKNSISYLCSPNARPRGCAYCSKGSTHMPKAWEGVPG